jgi:hypothetical protein
MFVSSKVSLQQSGRLATSGRDRFQAAPLDGGSLKHSAQLGLGTRLGRDRGGDQLQTARSLRRYLQGFTRPGSNRSLQDATGSSDPDYYRLFDNASRPLTFQGNGSLLLACSLTNRSTVAISIEQLNKRGAAIPGSFATVQPGESFNYPDILSRGTFYLKVTSTAAGQHRYELNLPIINS